MPSFANNHWPPCPYCGYKWPRTLAVNFVVMLPEANLETTATCPCGKSGIVMHFHVSDARMIDFELYRHYGEDMDSASSTKPAPISHQHEDK